ncbi:MAG: winged helix DNA-binding domain-containing protein [Polyangiaceae bacterium]
MAKVRMIGDEERRARLVRRHALDRGAADVVAMVRGVVALHSSDPLTPHLAAWARVPGYSTEHLDHALTETRSLWRLHAMRRTLFVVPAEEAPVFDAAAGRSVAEKERRRMEGWVKDEIGGRSVGRWLASLEAEVLAALSDGQAWRTQDLSKAVPRLATTITLGSGKWQQRAPLASRLLFVMAMEGKIVRGLPAGSWRSSQYRWAAAEPWFDGGFERIDEAEGRRALAERYLASHGPVTTTDLKWWTGWTARATQRALQETEAVPVALADGGEGWVLPNDQAPVARAKGVALLPGLDPTPMGWKDRGFYLGEHGDPLFDRNGNVGPTIWVDGRVVGGWAQRSDGEVVVRLLEDVGRSAKRAVEARAAELGAWLDGVVTTPRFRTPLERELSA